MPAMYLDVLAHSRHEEVDSLRWGDLTKVGLFSHCRPLNGGGLLLVVISTHILPLPLLVS